MDRRERALRQEIKRAELKIEEFGYSGSTHYRIKVRGPHGAAIVTTSLTPSDHRTIHKVRSHLKQIAEGRYEGLMP